MKHRLLFGVCIISLFSMSSCGSENGLSPMELENALITESSTENESSEEGKNSRNETMKPIQEQEAGENILQTNKESAMPEENDNPVAGIENSNGETVETEHENTSQIVYSATIEKICLPEEENLSTNVQDAEGLYVFLSGLNYRNETCDGLPEYSIYFDDGSQYYVNITDGWIWRGNNEEVKLTGDEVTLIISFIQ